MFSFFSNFYSFLLIVLLFLHPLSRSLASFALVVDVLFLISLFVILFSSSLSLFSYFFHALHSCSSSRPFTLNFCFPLLSRRSQLTPFLPHSLAFPLFPFFSSSFSLYGENQNREFDGSGWDETVRDGFGVGQSRTHGRTSRRIGRLAPVVRSMHVAPAGRRSSYISYTPFIPS